jgi:WD40 repeat protein
MRRLLSLVSLVCALGSACNATAAEAAVANQPPAEPILRIEPGMHTALIRRIAVDAQGRWLVTASLDKTARVWDLATGRPAAILLPPRGPGNEGGLYAVAISPNGATVALGGWTQFNGGSTAYAPAGNSIYLFDRASGRMTGRLAGLPTTAHDLAFSADGRYIAAMLGGMGGVRVYQADSGDLVGTDANYRDDSYGADFGPDGQLVTASRDGDIRLYAVTASGLLLLAKKAASGGKEPYTVRFSPDGRLVAVGFADSRRVDVLDGATLALRYAPDTANIPSSNNLSSVAWSADGQTLYAAGDYASGVMRLIRRWAQAGRGPPRDTPAATNSVTNLRALPNGGLVFASAEPAWGLIDRAGQRTRDVVGPVADLRNNQQGFQVARDGGTVRFCYDQKVRCARFSVEQGLSLEQEGSVALIAARTAAPNLGITEWPNSRAPKLNGKVLALQPYEMSLSLAIQPDGERFVLGTGWSVYLFDSSGRQLWRVLSPGSAWDVNVSGDGQTVVAAFGDGTIRWYDIQDGHEKLAFFPHADRKRWVAWTPSGYYMASPGGEDLIGWQLNHGNDAAADFFPASRFRNRFNRPDVVARALSTRSEVEALRLADAENERSPEAHPVSIRTLLPPVVEILSPQNGSPLTSSSVTVRYTARSPADAPVTGLRARVNGRAVSIPEARDLGVAGSSEYEVTIPVRAEDSEIELFAANRNGVSTAATVHLSWVGSAPALRPEMIFKPKLYLLAVGVSTYSNPAFDLGLPAKDARDFVAVWLKQKGLLYADVQVRLLTDADATKDNILDGLDWLQHQVTSRDVGMMFLAGHGTNDNTGKYFFLPYNADPERLLRTGVPQADLRDTLSSLAGKAMFFIDTCHSGNALGTARARDTRNDINGFVNDLASAENGVIVFTASTGRQFSLEDPAWGNGAFTKAVVEGLSGKADFQHTGSITHRGLDYYVAERVKDLTGGKQSPVSIVPQGIADFPIAVVSR